MRPYFLLPRLLAVQAVFFILNVLLRILPSIFFAPILAALAGAYLVCATLLCAASRLLSLLSSLSLPSFSFIISDFLLRVFLSISPTFSKSILPCKSLINLFVIVTIMSGTKSVLSVSSSFVKSVFGDYGIW